MVYAATRSAAVVGITGHLLDIEADIAPGLPGFQLIGLPEPSIWPTRDRVRAAILNSRLNWPDCRITVNVRPEGMYPYGAALDLAVAVSILAAAGHIPAERIAHVLFLGELGLDGRIRPVRGVLPAVAAAARAGVETVVVPSDCAAEAAQTPRATVIPAERLADLVDWLRDGTLRDHAYLAPVPPVPGAPALDLADVAGNHAARHALEVCAAGGHHLLLLGEGPATMLAERLQGILPPLDLQAAREVTEVHSVAGLLDQITPGVPPMYAPHHTSTPAAMFGGGTGTPRPGAISLAHRGVLYLDDAPEFSRQVLDGLRGPMETSEVIIAGRGRAVRFPARFMLAMAARDCPCPVRRACGCTPLIRRRYLDRLVPLLDRVTVRARLQPMPWPAVPGEPSAVVAARVRAARERATARLAGTPWRTNAEVPALDLRTTFRAELEAIDLLRSRVDAGALTPATFTRVLRLAWTLADLRGAGRPAATDAATALDLWSGESGHEDR
ncbi:ATP-binding protein [Streptosporangium soli]|nr:ATP-binding protein [Streptosporangium sp. KLBMP 9127]